MSVVAEPLADIDEEAARLQRWEAEMLLDLGFEIADVLLLTAIPNFTWHDAKNLIDRGMSHKQAVDQLT